MQATSRDGIECAAIAREHKSINAQPSIPNEVVNTIGWLANRCNPQGTRSCGVESAWIAANSEASFGGTVAAAGDKAGPARDDIPASGRGLALGASFIESQQSYSSDSVQQNKQS